MKKLIAFLLSLSLLAPLGFARPTSRDTNSAAQTTALQLLDDAVYVDDADWTSDTSKHTLVGGVFGSNTITSGDVGPLMLDTSGDLLVSISDHANSSSTPVDAVQLDDDPTTYTSAAVDVSGYQRIGFVVDYDETEVGNAVSGAFSITGSFDGTDYYTVPFMDVAGGATPQTSETISADGSYIAWALADLPYKNIKVTFAGTNTDSDDIIVVTVDMYYDK